MVRTIKEASDVINDVLTTNFTGDVKSVRFSKFSNTQKVQYPTVNYYLGDTLALDKNADTITFTIEFMDVGSGRKDKDNRVLDIVSDMFSAASQFYQYLINNGNLQIKDKSIQHFDNRYKDGLAGVELALTINISGICL